MLAYRNIFGARRATLPLLLAWKRDHRRYKKTVGPVVEKNRTVLFETSSVSTRVSDTINLANVIDTSKRISDPRDRLSSAPYNILLRSPQAVNQLEEISGFMRNILPLRGCVHLEANSQTSRKQTDPRNKRTRKPPGKSPWTALSRWEFHSYL